MLGKKEEEKKINSDAQIKPQELNYIKEKRILVRFNPNKKNLKNGGEAEKENDQWFSRFCLTLRRRECGKNMCVCVWMEGRFGVQRGSEEEKKKKWGLSKKGGESLEDGASQNNSKKKKKEKKTSSCTRRRCKDASRREK